MQDILFENNEIFKEAIDKKRRDMLNADNNLLTDRGVSLELDELTSLPNGRFDIFYKNVLFECVFHYKSEKRLYVLLNGALTKEAPQFSRWSYYPLLSGCMLNIADPMYHMYPDLKLGWYYGSSEQDLRVLIAELIIRIAGILNIKRSNIIFLGSSGGGAATMECAGRVGGGAKAVAINPQIVLREYGYGRTFTSITNLDLSKEDIWHRNDARHWLENKLHSYCILIFNARSDSDMKQIGNICEKLQISVKYGLNVFEQGMIWIYDAECEPFVSAHSAQEFYCIIFVIEFLLDQMNVKNLQENFESVFRLINEFWYFRWQEEKRLRLQNITPDYLVFCRETKKRVVLWGSGEIALQLSNGILALSGNNYYKIYRIIDNDKRKDGTYFADNILIKHPSYIHNWKEYFVIIAVNRGYGEICSQLEEAGMRRQTDYIHWTELLKV